MVVRVMDKIVTGTLSINVLEMPYWTGPYEKFKTRKLLTATLTTSDITMVEGHIAPVKGYQYVMCRTTPKVRIPNVHEPCVVEE